MHKVRGDGGAVGPGKLLGAGPLGVKLVHPRGAKVQGVHHRQAGGLVKLQFRGQQPLGVVPDPLAHVPAQLGVPEVPGEQGGKVVLSGVVQKALDEGVALLQPQGVGNGQGGLVVVLVELPVAAARLVPQPLQVGGAEHLQKFLLGLPLGARPRQGQGVVQTQGGEAAVLLPAQQQGRGFLGKAQHRLGEGLLHGGLLLQTDALRKGLLVLDGDGVVQVLHVHQGGRRRQLQGGAALLIPGEAGKAPSPQDE